MRHLHSESHFRHALFALQEPDGYVDSLLEMARHQSAPRRGEGKGSARASYDLRLGVNRRRGPLP